MADEVITPNAQIQANKEQQIAQVAQASFEAHTGQTATESPLEEARKLDASIKNNLNAFNQLTQRFEKAAADIQIGGRSFAGQEAPKQEDPKAKARRLGEELAKSFLANLK